jgi:hypothetical protein
VIATFEDGRVRREVPDEPQADEPAPRGQLAMFSDDAGARP